MHSIHIQRLRVSVSCYRVRLFRFGTVFSAVSVHSVKQLFILISK